MAEIELQGEGLGHGFGRTRLFHDLAFTAHTGEVLLVRGPNGSGKSTLLKIMAGFLRPDRGEIMLAAGDRTIKPREYFHRVGMCTPEMRLYEELTGLENLMFFARLRGVAMPRNRAVELLKDIGLGGAVNRPTGCYSSGMKQRLKLLLAAFHTPPLLLLDEPGSNLDEAGMEIVSRMIREQAGRGVVVLASNDTREFPHGTRDIRLGT